MVLARAQARDFYDRFGRKQDKQGFYEDPAIELLVAHAGFATAQSVLEFGCGTGRLAERLMSTDLSPSAVYHGIDLSCTMVELARERLAKFDDRARVSQSDGSIEIPLADHSVDRVLSTYVLDILSDDDIKAFTDEAHRVLARDGKLCLVSLAYGVGFLSRLVIGVWRLVYRARPTAVGGCRPLRLRPYLSSDRWIVEFNRIVVAWGIPSEVLVAAPVH